MDCKEIYEFSYKYLKDEAKGYFTVQQIDDHISNPDAKNCNSISEVYECLLYILQDFNRYPKVIQYNKRKESIKQILHNYDLDYISELNPDCLFQSFKEEFKFTTKTMWLRYSKGIISGAKFIKEFKNYDDLKSTFDAFDVNDMKREEFALLLSTKIDNMGFASACNWLKELGYYKYVKPDIHLKAVCDVLCLSPTKNDIDYFEAIIKFAKAADVEPYTLDKVWWLICTGTFYRYDVQLPNPQKRKDDFLAALKQKFVS